MRIESFSVDISSDSDISSAAVAAALAPLFLPGLLLSDGGEGEGEGAGGGEGVPASGSDGIEGCAPLVLPERLLLSDGAILPPSAAVETVMPGQDL